MKFSDKKYFLPRSGNQRRVAALKSCWGPGGGGAVIPQQGEGSPFFSSKFKEIQGVFSYFFKGFLRRIFGEQPEFMQSLTIRCDIMVSCKFSTNICISLLMFNPHYSVFCLCVQPNQASRENNSKE